MNGRKAWTGRAWAATGLLSGALLLAPGLNRPAQACGGFWCSQQAPVNQAAEEIIFIDHPDDTVTAIIRIQYTGPSERFAWLIPIAGKPKVAVSSNMAFQRLERATVPTYTLQTTAEGMCKVPNFGSQFGSPFAASGAGGASASSGAAGGVSVVGQGSVGPYDYVTIAVDPEVDKPADVALEWFETEGYDLTGVDSELLGPYLAEGLNLLAFKLTKSSGNQTGAIRPVMLTYKSDRPMVPIRPTAVAATDDMGVKVWVVGEHQAVPENYKSLVVNDALIDWLSFGSNYDEVVTAAANDAGGQGFVTELAAATGGFAETVFLTAEMTSWEQLQAASYAEPADAIEQAGFTFRQYDGWREAVEAAVELSDEVTLDQFIASPSYYAEHADIDVAKFFIELRARAIEPLAETQRLINSRPYLTRLYSTMSADEMTVDPAFAFNAELAYVSNTHTAWRVIECDPSVTVGEAPWRVRLPQGGLVRGRGSSAWPVRISTMPANLKIVQLGTSGSGLVVEDNSKIIGDALSRRLGLPENPPMSKPAPPPMAGSSAPAPMSGVMIGGTQQVVMQVAEPPAVPEAPKAANRSKVRACAVAGVGAGAGGGPVRLGWLELLALVALGVGARRREEKR